MNKKICLNTIFELAETEFKLPRGAVLNIPYEDDWSFLIKLSAIIEKILGRLICEKLNDHHIVDIILSLSLAKKIELAKDKSIIDKSTFNKLVFIKKIRNIAAHGINFSFDEYLENIDNRNAYKDQFSNVWNEKLEIGDKAVDGKLFMEENPKMTLFLDSLSRLSISKINIEYNKLKSDKQRLKIFTDFWNKTKLGNSG